MAFALFTSRDWTKRERIGVGRFALNPVRLKLLAAARIEKRDQLRALIPADVFKIDNLNKARPTQLIRLKEGLAVAEGLQRLNAELLVSSNEHPH
jgi:hypothetical protein